MKSLKRFGDGIAGKQYLFPAGGTVSFNDNFAQVITQPVRLPGMDGAFDPYGVGRSPHESGNVQASFWLFFDSPADARSQIATVKGLSD